ncbi:LysE family translocator [Silicimonas algicola]|nr:LysE family translocator [Silicimonas algicola]
MSPGPNGVLIARTVPTSGKSAGFANIAGFVAAFYVHGTLSILGISVILVQSAAAFTAVKLLGAAYLVWIGLKALHAAWRGGVSQVAVAPARRERTLARAFVEGFLTNALNPKVSMFYLAAFPQFVSHGESAAAAYALVSVHSSINVLWFGSMVLLFSKVSQAARGPGFQRGVKLVTGVVFIGFGLKLATQRAPV